MKSFYNITILFALVIVYINTHAQSITFEKTFGEPYPSFNEGGSGALQTMIQGILFWDKRQEMAHCIWE